MSNAELTSAGIFAAIASALFAGAAIAQQDMPSPMRLQPPTMAASPQVPSAGPSSLNRISPAPTPAPAPDRLAGERDALRRKLVSFVVVEYLGSGMSDHRNQPESYADEVEYYGRRMSRAAVMADKAQFYRRWPARRYDLVENSLTPRPGSHNGVEFSFRYTYEASNGRKAALGSGITTLEVVLEDGRPVIVKETSKATSAGKRRGA